MTFEFTPEEKALMTSDQEAALHAIETRMEALDVLHKAFENKHKAKGFEEIQEYCDLLSYLAEIVVEKHRDLEKKWAKLDETNGDKKEAKPVAAATETKGD
jgi:cell division septum initiation protein DivIVA